MKTVIEFAKRYLVEIICGLAAIGGVVFIFLGLGGMKDVKTELESATRIKSEIGNMLRSPAINERAVKQEEARIADIRSGFGEVMDFVRDRNFYKPLVEGAFPGGESAAQDRNNAIAFRDAYNRKMREWLDLLNAGDVPTEAQIANEKDRMEQQLRSAEEALGVGNREDNQTQRLPMDPEVSASIGVAREIYCYANPESFHESAYSDPSGPMDPLRPPPNLTEMWEAQLEVWIQDTLVRAIAKINNDAAQSVESGGDTPWVGNLPIKDIEAIQLTQYYLIEGEKGTRPGAGGRRGGRDSKERPAPPGTPEAAFTARTSDQLHEVLQFTVRLVVDARDIPKVLAGLCDQRFHVPLRVSYDAIPPNLEMRGKIFGEDPVVELTVDFETVMFSELYLPLMPQEILDRVGKQRPEPKDNQEV